MSMCEKCKNAKTCPYSKYNFDEHFFDCDDYEEKKNEKLLLHCDLK